MSFLYTARFLSDIMVGNTNGNFAEICRRGEQFRLFCARCKSEYREGFTTCSDCNVPLVDELPSLKNGWIADGSAWPQYEGLLIGDKEGLNNLKMAIETAIRDGNASIDFRSTAFAGVQVVETDPGTEKHRGSRLKKFGCITVLSIAGFIFLMGSLALYSFLYDYISALSRSSR